MADKDAKSYDKIRCEIDMIQNPILFFCKTKIVTVVDIYHGL